jgi:hypothetical protein
LPTIQSTFVTVTCDACEKSVTFPATKQGQGEAIHDNPWLNNLREVMLPDGRRFSYCSDVCEADGVAKGTHNKPEEKKIITQGNDATVSMAAKAAAQAAAIQAAMRTGSGITIEQ